MGVFDNNDTLLKAGKSFPLGTERVWGGIKYKKTTDGWIQEGKPVSKTEETSELNETERKSLDDYIGTGFLRINRELFKGEVSEEIKKKVSQLNSALDKLTKFEGNVYRGIAIDDDKVEEFLEKTKKGSIYFTPTFTSTTKEESVIQKFVGNVKIEIESKTGRDISGFNEKEKEVLFKNNVQFRVKSQKVKIYETPFTKTHFIELKLQEIV